MTTREDQGLEWQQQGPQTQAGSVNESDRIANMQEQFFASIEVRILQLVMVAGVALAIHSLPSGISTV